MERTGPSLVYLDTHVVVWLYAGLKKKLTDRATSAIEEAQLRVSQMVRLELQYLHEIRRITVGPSVILNNLSISIGLEVSDTDLNAIVGVALKIDWTRDVFDRLLTAEVILVNAGFITADHHIRNHLEQAIW
ncbi:MAG: type II toxin-antitoxin system VapC family toxin [Desulfobacteraceae bacterium]